MTPIRRLLAVDPSLTCSGWALLCLESERLLAVGKVRSLSSKVPLAKRLLDMQEKILSIFKSLKLASNDVLICEAPTTMRDPGAAFKVEQVRCIFETVARANFVAVPGRLNPRSVHSEVMGFRGRQRKRSEVKDAALHLVVSLFSESLASIGFPVKMDELKQHQDIVDALLLGYLGVTKIRSAERAGIDISEMFQGGKVFQSRRSA